MDAKMPKSIYNDLRSQIALPLTNKNLLSGLLLSLGDPYADKGNTANMEHRFAMLIMERKPNRIILEIASSCKKPEKVRMPFPTYSLLLYLIKRSGAIWILSFALEAEINVNYWTSIERFSDSKDLSYPPHS